ncbi:glycosyltransferase [Tessaracoccus sp. MC1679]|uniref:glycosyltransferase family 2 protein n=1 Tax=Tessaracoccus sp. MC1679 TaxID=2760313 RepID=UPI0016013A5D|nr:glycosyltransferase family 2 protein [Tessaracoccus sp. MC1679]MBB1517128.1 glycosyltransferase [Tessaracoccus sp. MC1679]
MTLASVIIPSRGGAQRLPTLLSALAAQDDPSWEAIVVIDGDIDNSASVVARYERQLPVRSIVFPENRGRVAALNAGLESAAGDVLIRCDDDMEPRPDYVAQHRRAHQGEPCGVVGLPLNVCLPTPYWRAYGEHVDAEFRRQAYASPPERTWRYWGGNVSVSRSVHEEVGPYSTDFRGYGYEDVDYGYRLHRAGVPVRLVRELETRHHMASVTTQIRARRGMDSGAARRIFSGRHGTDVLGDPWDLEAGAWNQAVKALARGLTPRRTATLARGVDRAAAVLPRPVSRKLIALVVESAALAGYGAPDKRRTH